MGLRCLLGHDFSEPEIEREREEDGEEVVTTVREVKTCARCGETQVVSENTEVTTMKQLTDQATSGEASSTGAIDPPERTEPTGSADGPGGTGTPTESSPDAGGTDRDPDIDYGGVTAGVDVGGPDEDDAEILDETSTAADVDPGDSESQDPVRTDDAPAAAAADDHGVAADDEGAELIDDGPSEDAADGSADDSRTPSDPVDPSDVDDAVDANDANDAPDGVDASADSAAGSGDFAGDRDHAAEGSGNDENAADDDGVILDDGDDTGATDDRDRGEWPEVEADDDATFEETPWPEQQGEDEGFDAEVGGDGESGVEFGGLTPETAQPTTESADAEYVEPAGRASASGSAGIAVDDESDDAAGDSGEESGALGDGSAGPSSGITREEDPVLETAGSSKTPTEYYCPECGMTVESDGSSMRAGDICPECKRGYVAERPR